jgi:hypothetical protein
MNPSNSKNLYEYYSAQGQTLPSVQNRQGIASQAGIQGYQGTAQQNTQLLGYLQQQPITSPGVQPKIDPTILGTQPKDVTTIPVDQTAQNNVESKVGTTLTGNQVVGKDGNTITNYSDGTNDAPITSQQQQSSFSQQLKDVYGKMGTKNARAAEIQQEEGVQVKKDEVRSLERKAMAIDQLYQKKIEAIQGSGLSAAETNSQIQQLQRRQTSEKADIAIERLRAQGDYQSAFEIAQSKVDAEFAPYESQLENLKAQISLWGNDMTEKEKLEAEQAFELKKANLEAAKKSATDDAFTLGKDQTRFDAQGNVIARGSDVGDGSGVGTQAQLTSLEDQVTTVDGLLNSKGIDSAVGPTFFNRDKIDFTGQKQNFIAGTQQLVEGLTLEKLINAKANGATFGALSEGELRLLAASASKIGSWANKNSNGKVTGYSAREKDFKAELEKIANYAKRDYVLKGGDPVNVGATKMPDGSIYTKNRDGSITSLKAPGESTSSDSVSYAPGTSGNRPQRNNNPLNIKKSAFTSSFNGVAGVDPKAASDGGQFLTFKTPEDGFNAAARLLSSGVYKNLSVDQALKKWSNNGYGADLVPQYKGKTIGSLSQSELLTIIRKMAEREGYFA